MKIISSILTKNPCYKSGKKITVKGLMLHSVGCPQPSASVFVKNWNKESYDRACVHGFIDANTGDIYQTLPWNYRGWHCGKSGNNTHIGVEMCEPNCIKYTSGASFTCSDTAKAKEMAKRTYDAAVELFAFLCKEYKLDPMTKGVIVSHKEGAAMGIASNHGDPEHLWNQLGMGLTMDTFRTAVKNAMGGSVTPTPTPTPTPSTSTELKKGSKGAAVKTLQQNLNTVMNAGLYVDGDFGSKTETAVKNFQKKYGLYVDGIYGPKSDAKMKEVLNASNNVYVVQKGDTLSGIAKKYNTTSQELAKYNGISDPNKISVGQKIKIPS